MLRARYSADDSEFSYLGAGFRFHRKHIDAACNRPPAVTQQVPLLLTLRRTGARPFYIVMIQRGDDVSTKAENSDRRMWRQMRKPYDTFVLVPEPRVTFRSSLFISVIDVGAIGIRDDLRIAGTG